MIRGRNPEGKVQDKIMPKLESIKDSYWDKPTITNRVGASDIHGDILGRAVYIEVKRSAECAPTAAQQYYLNKAVRRGAIAFCTHSWPDCKRQLELATNAKGIPLDFIVHER